jgi:tricorn protease-like protein
VDFFDGGQQALVRRWGQGLSSIVLENGDERQILDPDEQALLDADLSRDDRWLAIKLGHPDDTVSITILPFADADASPDDWIHVAGGDSWVGAPRWSADGRILYYLSARDDFICVWGQHLDSKTKAPIGKPFPVVHLHAASMNMMAMARFMWNLEVGADRLVFNAGEMSGDVYTAILDEN